MAWYYSRQSAFTAATKALASLNTGVDGTTPGNIRVPFGASAITKITAAVVTDGGQSANTGIVFNLQLSGAAMVQGVPQLVIGAQHKGNGGGAITSTSNKLVTPTVIPVFIPVKAGNDLTLSGSYYGTDSGNQYVGVTLEFS